MPISLDEFKADKAFAGWDLLRIGRLSVVPVPDPMWKRVLELAKEEE
jgi:predicted RNA-binding protein with PUA-like domain